MLMRDLTSVGGQNETPDEGRLSTDDLKLPQANSTVIGSDSMESGYVTKRKWSIHIAFQ